MWPIFEDAKVYNVRDIYESAKENNRKLLSEYGSDFWAGYKANYQYFDRLFMKKYTSLIPIDQDYEEGVQSIQEDFTYDVYAWLMANDKRYTELYRVNTIPDNDAYSLTNNVDYTEITTRDVTFNKGSQENTVDAETGYGQQIVDEDNSTTFGARSGTETKSVSAYNSNTYEPSEQTATSELSHEDTQDNSTTYGAHTDTRDDTYTEGAREDTTDEDITMHKVGNMGVQTVDDMLLKHWNNWSMFDFYSLIFDDIAKNLLRGC